MSWSIQKTMGEPQRVKASIEPQFDSAIKSYDGKTEADDVLAAKAAVLAFLDGVPAERAAIVEASGSRGAEWMSIKVECSAIKLV